jgi:Macrocin-O-methyltransferase (TylF)
MTDPSEDLPPDGVIARLRWGARVFARMTAAQRFTLVWTMLREAISFPMTVLAFFVNPSIHPAYRLTWRRRLMLALRIYRNSFRVMSLVSYKAQLMMAVKLFEIPPEVPGVVVECGCFLGGTSTNLSLACALAGRQLILYDSFAGLPKATPGERIGQLEDAGKLHGSLERVRANIARTGDLSVCVFREGFFEDTLPKHGEPIVLAFLDVDFESSLHDCVVNLWPHLVPNGYLFLDEYVILDFCALFFSEHFWRQHFGEEPPGLLGAGTGVDVGHYYWGPWPPQCPLQMARSTAYTWKGNRAVWTYLPEPTRSGAPACETPQA